MVSRNEALLLIGVFVYFLFGEVQLTTICSLLMIFAVGWYDLTTGRISTNWLVWLTTSKVKNKRTTREKSSRVAVYIKIVVSKFRI